MLSSFTVYKPYPTSAPPPTTHLSLGQQAGKSIFLGSYGDRNQISVYPTCCGPEWGGGRVRGLAYSSPRYWFRVVAKY